MKIRATPFHEEERSEAVRKYHILDTEYEQDYNDIVELATQICKTPIGVITILDDSRQWFKAKKGLDVRETDISIAFSAYTAKSNGIFVIDDALEDDRFLNNPLVTGPPHIRFYAGVPLKMSDGTCIGSLEVLDIRPRRLTSTQLEALRILTNQVINLLQLRVHDFELEKLAAEKASLMYDVLDRVSDAFVAIDNDWNIVFINERAKKMTGREHDDVIGKNLWDEFPEALSSAFPRLAQQAMLSQTAAYNEEYFAPYNRWLEAHIYPSPTGLSVYFTDITYRKNAERALKESEQNYRRLVEGNPQPMLIYALDDLMILEVNEAAIRKYGYSRKEFLSLSILDLRPAADAAEIIDFIRHGDPVNKGFIQSGPWKHKLKNDDLIDVEITSHEIKWKGKRARFTLAWDVTKRLLMEDSLRHAEEQYRSIFENASEGIYQSTLDGRFITVNPAMAVMFGYQSPKELMTAVTDIGQQLHVDAVKRDELRSIIDNGEPVKGHEFRMRKKEGQAIWVRANIRGIKDSNGVVKYYEGTLEDVTHRKEAEEKLKQQFEELQKTNQELDRFVYSVSHDLRAPLATILGLIHVAELESPSPMFNEYLKMIRTNVKRLDGFINDILDYSLNARKEILTEEINFHDLVGEILKSFNFIVAADRLKVNLTIKNTVNFYSDRYRLAIVLNNLLSNAVKYQDFMKEESFVSVNIETNASTAVIRIADNGIGIQQKHLDKVFNMFYRASENSKGSGIGLYIAKETVNKLGGTITVESEFGRYSVFEVRIPNQNPSL